MSMHVETFMVGMLSTNCYVASCPNAKEAILIDPGLDYTSEFHPIFEYIEEANLKVRFIVNTHGHSDHVKANVVFQEKYKVPVCIHQLDAHFIEGLEKDNPSDFVILEEGRLIQCGAETLRVMHTPGHTPGSICLIGENLVFTGDTLFAGGIGRTDFPGGSISDMGKSLERLTYLPDFLLIYPGHGATSIMGEEKRTNPFLNKGSVYELF
jgi:hydroxyacylglutathione hydrolase